MHTANEGRGLAAVLSVWLAFNLAALAVLEDGPPPLDRSQYRPAPYVMSLFRTGGDIGYWQAAARLRYRLMKPAASSNSDSLPLVVFLHGAGQRGQDNLRQLRTLPETLARFDCRRERPCFVLAPQCPAGSNWSDWMAELESLILTIINQHAVDPRRVYLTGHSMGGYGTWELAARRPDLFAAVVPICGGGDPEDANTLATLAIWAVHGDADQAVPVERSREMIVAIREAGGHPRYSELPGVGHDCWTETYDPDSEVLNWMFEQVRSDLTRRFDNGGHSP